MESKEVPKDQQYPPCHNLRHRLKMILVLRDRHYPPCHNYHNLRHHFKMIYVPRDRQYPPCPNYRNLRHRFKMVLEHKKKYKSAGHDNHVIMQKSYVQIGNCKVFFHIAVPVTLLLFTKQKNKGVQL